MGISLVITWQSEHVNAWTLHDALLLSRSVRRLRLLQERVIQ